MLKRGSEVVAQFLREQGLPTGLTFDNDPRFVGRAIQTMGAIRPYREFAPNAFLTKQETPVAYDGNESD